MLKEAQVRSGFLRGVRRTKVFKERGVSSFRNDPLPSNSFPTVFVPMIFPVHLLSPSSILDSKVLMFFFHRQGSFNAREEQRLKRLHEMVVASVDILQTKESGGDFTKDAV